MVRPLRCSYARGSGFDSRSVPMAHFYGVLTRLKSWRYGPAMVLVVQAPRETVRLVFYKFGEPDNVEVLEVFQLFREFG